MQLNSQQRVNLRTEYVMLAANSGYLSWHGLVREVANGDHKMSCGQCYGNPHGDEQKIQLIAILGPENSL